MPYHIKVDKSSFIVIVSFKDYSFMFIFIQRRGFSGLKQTKFYDWASDFEVGYRRGPLKFQNKYSISIHKYFFFQKESLLMFNVELSLSPFTWLGQTAQ